MRILIGNHRVARFFASGLYGAAALFWPAARSGRITSGRAWMFPATYRGAMEADAAEGRVARSLGDQKWWEVFQDPQLQQLIRTALQQNYDVRIAATRVLEAQAQAGHHASGSISERDRRRHRHQSAQSSDRPDSRPTDSHRPHHASAAWDLDFWGKYRRATEAARANLLASEWARQEVNATLVANVAAAYFQLRELDLELEISKSALASRKESLDLTKTLEEHGINSILDVRQAEQLVYTAAAEIADLERRIAQQEDLLSVLLGNNPGPITPRGMELIDQPHAPTGSGRASLRAAGAPPGHPPVRATNGRGQRPDRRCQGRLFSGHFPDGDAGIPESALHEPFQRLVRSVDVCRNASRSRFSMPENFARTCAWPRRSSRKPS